MNRIDFNTETHWSDGYHTALRDRTLEKHISYYLKIAQTHTTDRLFPLFITSETTSVEIKPNVRQVRAISINFNVVLQPFCRGVFLMKCFHGREMNLFHLQELTACNI